MAAATTAIASGMAILLCIVLNRRCTGKQREKDGDDKGIVEARSAREQMDKVVEMERRFSWRSAEPPSRWQDAVTTVAETIRFTYSETLGRWPIGDLAFGIRLCMRRQSLQVASVFAGSNCLKLEGSELMDELIFLSRLLDLCIVFSKKSFSAFLKRSGYYPEDIIFGKNKAGLLKPAFTVLRDKNSKCILLIVRGMHSIKDTLTAANGLVVPFHHSILDEHGVPKVVLGYAHHGMVSAAHWIAKSATPFILKAVGQYPSYKVKIVGNSLGAGVAALLTYILREHKELSTATCIAFAPAACMTWDLAESGQNFITTIVNGSDLVPTFSIVSADNLRLKVAASSWLSDLSGQFCLPFASCTEAISCKSQQAALTFAKCMDCLGFFSCHERDLPKAYTISTEFDQHQSKTSSEQIDHSGSCINQHRDGVEEDPSMQIDEVINASTEEEMIEKQLWIELEKELQSQEEGSDANVLKEESASETTWSKLPISADEIHFFPPGRIRHIVAEQESDVVNSDIGMYETARRLYGEIRLSPNMIKDHYMPVYKRMIDLMIENHRRKESS